MTTATASLLSLELPNPESDNPIPDFENIISCAWGKADQASLVSDVVKGRVLRTVRDREKKAGPDSKGQGFLGWLKTNGISKSSAYDLIDLANAADRLIESGAIAVEHLERFTKKAFVQMAKSSKEIQGLVCQRAASGEVVGKEEIKDIDDQLVVCASDLSDEIKEKATAGSIPPKYLAPLVKEMDKLPPAFVASMQEAISKDDFDASAAKEAAKEAKNLNAFLEKSPEIAILEGLDVEAALNEAFRIGSVGDATNLVKVAQKINKAATDLYANRSRLGKLSDRLYVDTGASTPNLRHLLSAIDRLIGDTIQIPVGEDKTIWIRISEEGFSTSEATPTPDFPDPHLEKVPHVWAEYVRFCESEGLDTKNIAAAVWRLLRERDELASALNIIEGRDREIDAQRDAIVAKQSELNEVLAEREQLIARIAEMESRLTLPEVEAIAPIETKIEIVAPVEAIAPTPAPVETTEPAPKPQAIASAKAPAPEPKAIAPQEILAGEILEFGGDSLEAIKLDKATAFINDSATFVLEISRDSAMGMAKIKFNLGQGATVTRVPLDEPLQIAPDAIALVPTKTKANGWQIDVVQLATGDRVEGLPQYTLEKAWAVAEIQPAKPKQRKEKNAAAPKADGYDTYENRKQIARAVEAIVSTKSEEEIITIPLSEPCYLTPETLGVKSKDAMTTELVINGQVAWKIQGEEAEFRLNDLLFDQQEVGDRVLQLIASYAAANNVKI